MATIVAVTGQGGMAMGGSAKPMGQGAGPPPELHLTQWGVYRLDIGLKPQERP